MIHILIYFHLIIPFFFLNFYKICVSGKQTLLFFKMENKPQVFPASDKMSDAMKEANEMGTKIAAQASNEIGVIENNKPNEKIPNKRLHDFFFDFEL
mgnify:CR=1 FL=1